MLTAKKLKRRRLGSVPVSNEPSRGMKIAGRVAQTVSVRPQTLSVHLRGDVHLQYKASVSITCWGKTKEIESAFELNETWRSSDLLLFRLVLLKDPKILVGMWATI
jgi:hypothetical protein